MKNKGHLGVIADSQSYNSLQYSCEDQYNFVLHAHMHLEIMQNGHFNGPILYSSIWSYMEYYSQLSVRLPEPYDEN